HHQIASYGVLKSFTGNRIVEMLDWLEVSQQLNNKIKNALAKRQLMKELIDSFQKEYEMLLDMPPEFVTEVTEGKKPISHAIPLLDWGQRSIETSYTTPDDKIWAINVLPDSNIAAIDGSQIYPETDLTAPVAVINTGTYLMKYKKTGSEADACSNPEIYIGRELLKPNGALLHKADIDVLRFRKEVEACKDLMGRMEGDSLIMLDTPMVLSFLTRRPEARDYINELVDLLDASEAQEVPLVGYIDFSMAKDIAGTILLNKVCRGRDCDDCNKECINREVPNDGSILQHFITKPGARSPVFVSQRNILSLYPPEWTEKLCFFYIRTPNGYFSRVEFPRWIAEAGLVDRVHDLILAQINIGFGYPYILTRAHEQAVISTKERKYFIDLYEERLRKSGVKLDVTPKAYAKTRGVV
ncbi:MAG: DNA double-strand break repair nuclease NurA, partial [Candidatus Hodarchaeota archaeon]